MTLTSLRANLKQLIERRDKAAIDMEAVEAPRRRYLEAEAARKAGELALAEAEEQETQLRAELSDCLSDINRTAPRETKIKEAIDVLGQLADDGMLGRSLHIDPYLLGRAISQCRTELELLENARMKRQRLEAALKDLGVKL